MMMIIALNSRALKQGQERREVKEEYGSISEEKKGNTDYGEMVQLSQQYVAPCVKGVEWTLGTRGLRMVTAFGPASR